MGNDTDRARVVKGKRYHLPCACEVGHGGDHTGSVLDHLEMDKTLRVGLYKLCYDCRFYHHCNPVTPKYPVSFGIPAEVPDAT